MARRSRHHSVIGPALALICMLPTAISTHERLVAGPYRLTVGWGDEPAFTGFKNFVSVAVSDADGKPVRDLTGNLAVEIAFGDERRSLSLRPAFQRPDEFRAVIVPTRAGTYSFHITGTLNGRPIDATSTCSDRTFSCVADAAAMAFPVQDPSTGQLAESVSRALPRAERAVDTAVAAQRWAIAGFAVAGLALVAVVGLALRGGGKVA